MKILKTKYLVLALLATFCFSCSPEDGDDGIDGAQGIAGTNGADGADGVNGTNGNDGANGVDGSNGVDGTNGTNGLDGADGTNGADGADGNANVQAFVFDTSAENGLAITINTEALRTAVSQSDDPVILTYMRGTGSPYYAIPGPVNNADFITSVGFSVNGIFLFKFQNFDGTNYSIATNEVRSIRIIVIPSTSTITGTSKTTQQVKNELNKLDVDINDYHAVCDYYNLAH